MYDHIKGARGTGVCLSRDVRPPVRYFMLITTTFLGMSSRLITSRTKLGSATTTKVLKTLMNKKTIKSVKLVAVR